MSKKEQSNEADRVTKALRELNEPATIDPKPTPEPVESVEVYGCLRCPSNEGRAAEAHACPALPKGKLTTKVQMGKWKGLPLFVCEHCGHNSLTVSDEIRKACEKAGLIKGG